PTLASSLPLQGLLLLPAAPAGPTRRPVGLRRPSSCLSAASPAARLPQAPNVLKPGPTVASPGLAPALRRCLHAPDFLQPASPGPAPPPGGLCRPTLASSLGLSRARSCSRRPLRAQLVAQSASAGPAPASPRPPQLPDFLRSASPGPASPACHWPLEAQPRSGLWAASSGPGLDLQSASPGPASCLPKACTGPASASQRTLDAQLSPDCGLPRPELLLPLGSCAGPRSCLPVASLGPAHSTRGTAFPGPTFAFWRPLQAPNFLRAASPGPVAASRPPVRAQLLLLPAAAAGPAPASRQPLWTRLRPSSRSAAFVGPKRPEAGPHGGLSGPGSCPPTASPRPRLPPASLSRPSSSSRRPLQAHAGLESAVSRASSCYQRPLRAQLVGQSASAGPAPASPRPLQLPDFLRSASPGPAPPACHWPLEAQPRSRLWAGLLRPRT
ncbi:vegetative cell wall protein gp1-like, partial [Papio anubis]|uniref:vegetative cell wall protein gp1-like n=1 Tax=Papio anubis TaxID=9555 RepID=UPI0012AD7512